MNRIIAGCCVALVPLAVSVFGQNGTPVLIPGHGAGAPPAYAFDIPKAPAEGPPRWRQADPCSGHGQIQYGHRSDLSRSHQ